MGAFNPAPVLGFGLLKADAMSAALDSVGWSPMPTAPVPVVVVGGVYVGNDDVEMKYRIARPYVCQKRAPGAIPKIHTKTANRI